VAFPPDPRAAGPGSGRTGCPGCVAGLPVVLTDSNVSTYPLFAILSDKSSPDTLPFGPTALGRAIGPNDLFRRLGPRGTGEVCPGAATGSPLFHGFLAPGSDRAAKRTRASQTRRQKTQPKPACGGIKSPQMDTAQKLCFDPFPRPTANRLQTRILFALNTLLPIWQPAATMNASESQLSLRCAASTPAASLTAISHQLPVHHNQFTDSQATNLFRRFYRVRSP
jgi:hypothetical protein